VPPSPTARGQGLETENGSEEIGGSRLERVAREVTQAFRGAKRASGDRRRETYSPGRGNLKAAKRGERDKSSAGSESSESGSEHGVGVNYSKDSKTSRSITV
jgi:hypothetical protein